MPVGDNLFRSRKTALLEPFQILLSLNKNNIVCRAKEGGTV